MHNGSKLHKPPTNYHLLAAQQQPYKKNNSQHKIFWVFWREKKSPENGPVAADKWQDRKSKRPRHKTKTREDKGKGVKWQPWDSKLGDRHQTSPASLWGCPERSCWAQTRHSTLCDWHVKKKLQLEYILMWMRKLQKHGDVVAKSSTSAGDLSNRCLFWWCTDCHQRRG